MKLSPETTKKIKETALSVYCKIGAADPENQIVRTLRFAAAQPPVKITLDGEPVTGTVVDLASVFSIDGEYRKITDENGATKVAEVYRAVSIVITEAQVLLCKVCCDVLPATETEETRFLNARYHTTTPDQLTEHYIC